MTRIMSRTVAILLWYIVLIVACHEQNITAIAILVAAALLSDK